MAGAHRHTRFLEIQKELYPHRKCLEQSTDIRWSLKCGSISKILTLFYVILETLAEFSETRGQTKLEAKSLLHHKKKKSISDGDIWQITWGQWCCYFTEQHNISHRLPVADQRSTEYVQFWENVQNDFDKVLKLTDDLMEKNSISNWDVTSTRVRRLSAQLKESLFACSLGKSTAIIMLISTNCGLTF